MYILRTYVDCRHITRLCLRGPKACTCGTVGHRGGGESYRKRTPRKIYISYIVVRAHRIRIDHMYICSYVQI